MGGAYSRGSSLGGELLLLSETLLALATAETGICLQREYPPQRGRRQTLPATPLVGKRKKVNEVARMKENALHEVKADRPAW
jgi:hypothetical protein